MDWQPFEGDYEKRCYDALLPTGEVVRWCWPNAGMLVEAYPSGHQGRQWSAEDGVKFRPSEPRYPTSPKVSVGEG